MLALFAIVAGANADEITYQYDEAGRLRTATYPDTSSISYTLDAAGNRVQVQSVLGSGIVQLAVASASVSEGTSPFTINVTRTGASNGEISVSYTTANGTATAGSDYTATSGALSWTNGDSVPKTISVPILNDSTLKSSRTFSITLNNTTGGAILGAVKQASVTVTDNDTVSFSIANVSVNESAGTATFTVTKSGSTALTHAVSYATANGSAIAGSDYTSASGTLSFTSATPTQSFTVPITNDTVYEGNETFTVGLSAPTNGATLGTSSATGTIVENDAAPSFSVADVSVNEGTSTATFTVIKSGSTALTHAVSYATVNGTATVGSDYTAASGTLSFTSGTTSQTFTVSITNDTVNEGNEMFTVNLSAPTNGATLGTNSATGTIIDNDPPPVPGTASVPAPYNNTGSYVVSWGASTGNVTAYELLESIVFGGETLIYSGTATSLPISGRAGGSTYSYRVRACNGPACSSYNATQGNGAVVMVDMTAPTAPGQLNRTDTNLYWSGGSSDTGGSGVVTWYVYRDGSHIASTSTQSYNDVAAPANVTLTYTVRAVDRAGNVSAPSNAVTLYRDTIPPSTPGNFRATSVTAGSVTLAWDASSDAFGISWYRIARSGSGTVMGNGDASTSYTDGTVLSNTTYTYQIFAVDGHGVESAPASVTVTTPSGAPPNPTISGSGFVKDTDGSYSISWSASTGATYYLLNENGGDIRVNAPTTSRSFVQGNGTYEYRVRACTAAGVCSGFSNTKTVQVCIGSCD